MGFVLLTILGITAPIFLLIALGFAAVHKEMLARSDMRGLGYFVINFALPALLFKAMSQRALAEMVNIELMLVYTLGSLAAAAIALALTCVVQKRSLRSGAIVAMGMSLSNSAFMGFPVAQQLIGKEAGAMLALYAAVETMIMLPLLFTLAEIGENGQGHWTTVMGGILKRLLKNPMIIAIIGGVAFSASGLALPVAFARAIDMLSSASAPVALFCIGGTLAGLSLKGMTGDIGMIVAGKLILHPLAVFSIFLLLPFDNQVLRTAAILNAGMPMLSIYPILAQKYGKEGICAAALVVTTVMSFFTISALLWLTGAG
ncbi:AEC family transporter [Janthinobacterium sp. 17J80-10]|uniref:AEC family transporter n=1 Tax=Janthinobacterium sp. 17J80-10 TaxID=2497863 RepID=UPI0019D70F46|nr:AEC family transporter [Janthinobacterium sp. 17J80-10]